MSRSGYSDDLTNWALIKWRGAVESATRGQRGQRLLRELLAAMDAMPEKALIAHELEADGAHCALGVVGKQRGINLVDIDPEDPEQVSAAFDIAGALAQEIVFINDECGVDHTYVDGRYTYRAETPEQRWSRVRAWVVSNIKSMEPTA